MIGLKIDVEIDKEIRPFEIIMFISDIMELINDEEHLIFLYETDNDGEIWLYTRDPDKVPVYRNGDIDIRELLGPNTVLISRTPETDSFKTVMTLKEALEKGLISEDDLPSGRI